MIAGGMKGRGRKYSYDTDAEEMTFPCWIFEPAKAGNGYHAAEISS